MSVYLQDADVTIHQGDVLDELRQLPSESVHMCCTSPPFYGLRDYGTGTWEGGDPDCDHVQTVQRPSDKSTLEDHGADGRSPQLDALPGIPYRDTCVKCGARRVDQQIGLEATPDLWVARLVEVFREVRRVLRDDGTLWVEIGDSYNSQPRLHYGDQGKGLHRGDGQLDNLRGAAFKPWEGAKAKDLLGQPWMLAFALRADGWYLRSEIIWAKPNPMPESVTDRPTTSHSRVFMLSKRPRYFYDAEALREPASPNTHSRGNGSSPKNEQEAAETGRHAGWGESTAGHVTARNRRTVWTIATQPYPEAHFATWPQALCRDMILAGTSERGVCPECGAPWERMVERQTNPAGIMGQGNGRHLHDFNPAATGKHLDVPVPATTGWQPGCTHTTEPVLATVLDPFGGSGTTAHVARKLGRRAVLIELNAKYCALAARRLQQQSLFADTDGPTIPPPNTEPPSLTGTKNEQSVDRRKHGFNERWKARNP